MGKSLLIVVAIDVSPISRSPLAMGTPIEHMLSHTVCVRMLFNVIERTTRTTSQ